MKRGKLVVFEGVSGTGKETQAKLLQTFLRTKGIHTTIVFHPSPELKPILSNWRNQRNIGSMTEVYLLLADRSSRVREIIEPALARGEWVISLRNAISALVYQGKTPADRKWIAREFSRFEPKANTLFYFDITPVDAMNRVMTRHKKTGEPLGKFETTKLLNEKRNAYKKVLQRIPHIQIDAGQSIQAIHNQILRHLRLY